MLDATKLDMTIVWKLAKETRIAFLSDHTNPECFNGNALLLSGSNIHDNINSLAGKMKLETISVTKENISNETLKNAATIFTYLNYCPPKISSLIHHMFKTGTLKGIILALKSIMQTSKNNLDKQVSTKIFIKVMKIFNLQHFEEIESITTSKCYSGNCTKKVETRDNLEILGMR